MTAVLRGKAADGQSAAEITGWLQRQLPPNSNFFMLATLLSAAFGIPVGVLRDVENWAGLGGHGTMNDEQLEQLIGPYLRD
ncbi:hypothetical protein [Micromonospora sp. NBS 11-29]|uniref:hypothetical protein n=1 Tax=Micromonospora sp. NBS 11-29 TaxID=1960879 RepID=UPI000B76F4B5|nr:hypothetical protein [Micromonospora sp. NBS 11-29]